MGSGFSLLFHEIHYMKIRYIKVWVYFTSGTCGINWCVAFGCSDNGEPDPKVKELIPKQESCNMAHIFGKINGNNTLNFSFNGNGFLKILQES